MQRARDLDPRDPQIREVLVDVYSQQGAFERAVDTAEDALARHPRSARLHYKAGWAMGRLPQQPGSVERARRHLEQAAALNESWFEPHAEMGRLLRAAGREPEATPAFEKAGKLNPNVAGVAFNLAALYRNAGDSRASVMQRRFARLRAEQNRFTSMRRDYNQEPGDNAKAVTLAALEGRSGLFATALQRLRTALKADPANLAALKLYRRLDEQSRAGYPPYLPPGPGLAPAAE